MRRLFWVMAGMLCASAAAQQLPAPRPVSVGIVVDTSGSMGAKLRDARQFLAEFVKAANPQDEFFLIQSSDRPALTSAFTTDTDKIQNDLVFTHSKGRSALWDAVYLALTEVQKGRNPHKALLVISDGGDNSSRHTENEVESLARQAGVRIYAIGVYEPEAARGRTAEELRGPEGFNQLATQTGGRHFAVEKLQDIPAMVMQLDGGMRAPSKP
jgi:Ca-activated chloride channel family protein